ncbi:MAG: agmatine deiminase family protein [Armatimonadetes bacterium]|nr:agmatine deiminase family protein [Armatimonadota bacterium]
MERTHPSPAALGFSMPAEWEPHQATWTGWPFDDEYWLGFLEGARRELAEFLRTLGRYEPIQLLVADADTEADARSRLEGVPVIYHRWPLDDVWFRDSGPTFVRRAGPGGRPQIAPVRWRFNAWGGKYRSQLDAEAAEVVSRALGIPAFKIDVICEGGGLEVNGQGLGLTTRTCLLHPRRNPERNESWMSDLLAECLGVERWIWLDHGLEGDHTDGHIDTLARFVGPGTVVAAVTPPGDSNYEGLSENRRRLVEAGLEVVDLPIPGHRRELEGLRLAESYANFYIANGAVLVPQYEDENDGLALEILRPLFPEREVLGLRARAIVTGGGAFHCLTQQQPEGEPCDWR